MATEKIHSRLSLTFTFTYQAHNMAVKFGLPLCLSVNLFVRVTSAATERELQSYSLKDISVSLTLSTTVLLRKHFKAL